MTGCNEQSVINWLQFAHIADYYLLMHARVIQLATRRLSILSVAIHLRSMSGQQRFVELIRERLCREAVRAEMDGAKCQPDVFSASS